MAHHAAIRREDGFGFSALDAAVDLDAFAKAVVVTREAIIAIIAIRFFIYPYPFFWAVIILFAFRHRFNRRLLRNLL